MDFETLKYLQDNIVGMAKTRKIRSQSNDIIYFEEEMEWQSYDLIDLWMDHEEDLVDLELACNIYTQSMFREIKDYQECAKFRI